MLVPLLTAALACGAAAATVDPSALRAALVLELRAVPGDDVGASAAELLASRKVAFVVRPTTAAVAAYDARRREVAVGEKYVLEAGGGGDLPRLARRLAASVIHELEHAADLREAAGLPKLRDGELAAYGAEAVFLRRRLARDPDYAGLRAMDALVRSRLSLPSPRGPWWREPIPAGDEDRYIRAAQDHARIQGWYLVRAAAGGMKGVERAYDAAGSLRPRTAGDACIRLPLDEGARCQALAGLLARRVSRFAALLDSDPLVPRP